MKRDVDTMSDFIALRKFYGQMIQPCKPFVVNKSNALKAYGDIINILRHTPNASINNRWMLLVEFNNVFELGLSSSRIIPCSEETVLDLFTLIVDPASKEAYGCFRSNNLGSDIVVKMIDEPGKHRRNEDIIDVWEVNRMVLFDISPQTLAELEQNHSLLGRSFDTIVSLVPPLRDFQHAHGGLFLYQLTDKGEKLFRNRNIEVSPNFERAVNWIVDKQESLWEMFQIPWFRPEVPCFDEEHDNMDYWEKGKLVPTKVDPIGIIPCWSYALQKAGLSNSDYEAFKQQGFEYGLTQKTCDIVAFLNERHYVLKIYKLSKRSDGCFCATYDCHPKKFPDDWKILEVDIFDNHVMQHVDLPKLCGCRISFLRLLQYFCEIYAIRKPSQYEVYYKFNYSKSLDGMLAFDVNRIFKHPEDINLWLHPVTYNEDKEVSKYFVYGFFDFEASTDGEFHRPYCLSYVFNKPGESINGLFGENCAKQFMFKIKEFLDKEFCRCLDKSKTEWVNLMRMTKRPVLRFYAHNLHYDFQFMAPYLRHMKTCEKGNTLYSISCKVSVNKTYFYVEFWDTYSLFMCPLRDLSKSYLTEEQQKSIHKEVFPYKTYDSLTVFTRTSDWISITEAKRGFTDNKGVLDHDKYNEFVSTLRDLGPQFYNGGKWEFNLVRYALFYCNQDVRVLQCAFNNFRDLLLGKSSLGFKGTCPFSIDCLKHRTASSIGYYYADLNCISGRELDLFGPMPSTITTNEQILSWRNEQFFKIDPNDLIYKTAGPVRHLILKANRGGRCMVRNNGKFYFNSLTNRGVRLLDYDGVSLYPSAMARLWISSGRPSVFSGIENGVQHHYNERDFIKLWLDCDSEEFDNPHRKWTDCVVHVISLNSQRKLCFPVICAKDTKTKLNEWRNFEEESCDLWINGIDLQNFIDFQDGQFTWDKAIYWDNKRTIAIRECVTKLFRFRADNKKHPIQAVAKLMMNSISGKSLLKMAKTEVYSIDKVGWKKKDGKWQSYNAYQDWFNANFYRIKELEDCGTYVRAKVFCTDLSPQLPIFGQDVFAMARRIIQPIFNIAEDIEADHPEMSPAIYYTDTDSMHIREDILPLVEAKYKELYNKELRGSDLGQFHTDFNPVNGKEVVGSVEAYFLSKKIYCDRLVNVDGEEGFHFRMKGIPNDLLEWQQYVELYSGNIRVYDLLDKNHVSFIFKNGKIKSQTKMERTIMTSDVRISTEEENRTRKRLQRSIINPGPSKKLRAHEPIAPTPVSPKTAEFLLNIIAEDEHGSGTVS